jgi:hypothetical protein
MDALIGAAAAIIGAGINILVRMTKMTPRIKRVWIGIGTFLILTGATLLGISAYQWYQADQIGGEARFAMSLIEAPIDYARVTDEPPTARLTLFFKFKTQIGG